MKCKLCNDGLFIPLEDHINIYCKTANYPQCLQYSLYADAGSSSPAGDDYTLKNRRQFPRTEVQHRITLIKYTQSGEIATHYPVTAKTLDVGAGGMQITITDPLAPDTEVQFAFDDSFPKPLQSGTEVQFAFDDSFPKPLQSGTGRIEWCNRMVDGSAYHAGLSFKEKEISRAMEFYLGLQH
ncbi:MAG: PilZ domain-containing protein [Deltaproteobacteria bacterium]|nr:PilZ domain-containing protein [Deltaproteobacteria bacterium]